MRAAIKGWAWRTPLGSAVDEVTRQLLNGARAAAPNPRFDATTYACTLAAAIRQAPQTSRHARFLRRMGLYALECAREAVAQAGAASGARLGLYFGYGGLRAHWGDMMPAFVKQQADGAQAWERGLNLLHPFWMLQHLSNNAHALAAEELRAYGEGATFGGGNAGAQALSAAIRALEDGAVDIALVVAYDSLIEPETLVDLAARGMLSGAPLHALRSPYEQAACGFVPGEAAAALVLERATSSGALAYVRAAEAADGETTAPTPQTMKRLVADLSDGIEVVDGAGWAQASIDNTERDMLAEHVADASMLCCMMAAFGQVGAAAPLVQTIGMTQMLRQGMLAPIAGLRQTSDAALRALTAPTSVTTRSALALSMGTPGLAGAIRVDLDK